MAQLWFTSDWHLDHKNIIQFLNRPFSPFKIDNMNDWIIGNFNEMVDNDDKVYFLGDLAFTRDLKRVHSFLRRVKGDWTFIAGNHDYQHGLLQTFKQYGELYDMMNIHHHGKRITLCHYAMFQHSSSHNNTWQLYGHHHVQIDHLIQGKKMNVAVDLHNFKPVSFDDVERYMKRRDDNWDYKLVNEDVWVKDIIK